MGGSPKKKKLPLLHHRQVLLDFCQLPYALQNKEHRLELQKLMTKKKPTTLAKLQALDVAKIQKSHSGLWNRDTSEVGRQTLWHMWLLLENLEEGMKHLLVQQPPMVAQSITIEDKTRDSLSSYMAEHILTRCFLATQLRNTKLPLESVYAKYVQLAEFQKQELRDALLPVAIMLNSKRLLEFSKPSKLHEIYTQMLYARKGDKVSTFYVANSWGDANYKGNGTGERGTFSCIKMGQLLRITMDKEGKWRLYAKITHRNEYKIAVNLVPLKKPHTMSFILDVVLWDLFQYAIGENDYLIEEGLSICAVLTAERMYRENAHFDRVMVPAIPQLLNSKLIESLLRIVCSFLGG